MLMQHSDALHLLLFHQQSAEHTPLCQTAESVTCCCRVPYVSCLAFLPQTILQPCSNCHQGSNYIHIRFPLLNTCQYQGKRQFTQWRISSHIRQYKGQALHLFLVSNFNGLDPAASTRSSLAARSTHFMWTECHTPHHAFCHLPS